MKKRLIAVCAIYLLLSLVLSGCWDYVEYEDLAQVTAYGVDYDPQADEITVTLQYPAIKRSKSGGGSEAATPEWVVHAATAKNIFDALVKLQEIIPQRLFFGYIKVFVVGEDMAKHKIRDLLNLVDRTPVMRSSAYIVMAEGKAEDIIKTIDPAQMSSGDKIYKSIQLIAESGTASAVTVNEVMEHLAIGGLGASMPVIKLAESNTDPPGSKEKGKSGEDGKSQVGQRPLDARKEHPGTLRIDGMAAFQGDKLVGLLNDRESRGANFIKGKKIHSYIVSAAEGEFALDQLYYRILESKRVIKARLENGQPTVTVTVSVKADMRKYYKTPGSDFLFAEALDQIEEKLAESIRNDIEAALQKGQRDLRTDIFGFGFALYRKYPRAWKEQYLDQWNDIFPHVPVTVRVEAKVVNTGITTRKFFER